MALPKREKLKNRYVFRNIRKLRLITRSEFFSCYGKKSNLEEQCIPKVGLIISKKKLKLAWQRNKAKRKIEEAYRIIKSHYLEEAGKFQYLVFFLEPTVLDADFEELKQKMEKIFKC
ncbi:MAG TPA: ribonuclease P protein component [Vampirovibrionales bacterium]